MTARMEFINTEKFLEAWAEYNRQRPRGDVSCDLAYSAGWVAAREAAAKLAEDWDHRGDPGEAMYAAPRIRDRIKWFLRAIGEGSEKTK